MTGVRVLASGIDTLHLFTTTLVRRKQITALEAAKALAVQTVRHAPLPTETVAGHTLTVERHGARTAPLLLDSEHMAVRVNPYAAESLPSVAVELRALYLWQRGAEEAARQAQAVADALTDPPLLGSDVLRVSRLDLAVDFQGWIPSLEDDGRFVTRAADRAMHKQRSAFTGYMFGRGVLAARLYDKPLEIQRSGKPWFRQIWARSPGYDPAAPVWRLEFQVKREALRAMKAKTGEGEPAAVDTWPDALAHARAIWRLLSSRWLALRLPRTRTTRQRLAPEWEALHARGFADGTWAGTEADLYREARQAGSGARRRSLRGTSRAGSPSTGSTTTLARTWTMRCRSSSAGHACTRSVRAARSRHGPPSESWSGSRRESIALGTDTEVLPRANDDDNHAEHGGTP